MKLLNFFHNNISNFFNLSRTEPQNGSIQLDNVVSSNGAQNIDSEFSKCNDRESICGTASIQEIAITNCSNVSTALEFFDSPNIKDQLKILDSILFIKFFIDEDFGDLTLNDFEILYCKCQGKAIVILMASKEENKFSIYWKSKELPFFLIFTPFSDIPMKTNKDFYEFISEFLTTSLSIGYLGIQKDHEISAENNRIGLDFLFDTHGFNLLLLAASSGFVDIVKKMLEMGISPQSQDQLVNAQDLAAKGNHCEVVLTLLYANLPFPKTFDINACSDELKSFAKVTQELHAAIIDRNSERVKEIIGMNPNMCFFYNTSNESALKTAILNKAMDIYETLITHKLSFGPHENAEELWGTLNDEERKIIREIHFRNLKDLPEKHLNILMATSFVGHDVHDTQGKRDHVLNAYKFLNSNALLSVILMVVVTSKKLRTVFDFNRDSVHFADPTVTSSTSGMFYLSGRVYIGARQLLDKVTKYETYATMAHELCHFAMNLTYSNNANPYPKHDQNTIQEFEKISEACQRNRGKEDIIDIVYDMYPPHRHHAELIVRVPHLIALYHNQPETLKDIRETFIELFEFWEKKIVPEMMSSLPKIENRDEMEIEKKNEKIFKLRKIIFISSIISVIAVIFAITFGHWLSQKPVYNFLGLSEENKLAVKNGLIIYENVNVKFRELFPEGCEAYKLMTSNDIGVLLDGHGLNFTDPHYLYLRKLIDFHWTNMPENLKGKFLTTNFTFQNKNLMFKELHDIIPDVFKFLSSEQIKISLSGNNLKIGSMLNNSTDFYVQRNFIFENLLHFLQNSTYSNTREEFIDIIEKTNRRKFFILSSEAGAGKTITFEQLTMKIKNKFPMRWVSYIDLKDFTRFYNASGDVEDIVKLMENIFDLGSGNEFEREVFMELFKTGNAVLLWNGFDEISPTYENFIMNVMDFIFKNTTNVQYVCTRPLYSNKLEKRFNIKSYQLVPFTKTEREEFLMKFLTSKIQNFTKLDELIDKILNISIRLDFKTPLMLKMIAEIHDYPKLIESENLYEIYHKFVDSKVNIWQDKSEVAKHLSRLVFSGRLHFDVLKIYQKFAMQNEIEYINFRKLEVMQTAIPRALAFEEISRMGILYVNNETEFAFAHKTFAEFFIAKYFIDNIYNVNPEVELKEAEAILRIETFFYTFDTYGDIHVITDFLKHFIDAEDKSKIRNFHPVIANLFRTKFKKFLFEFLDTKQPIIFDWLLRFFKKDHKLLSELIQLNENETLCTATMNPVYRPTTIKYDEMKNFSKNLMTDREFQKFTSGRNQKGVILFGLYNFKFFNNSKNHDKYQIPDDPVEESLFFSLFDRLQPNLTKAEQKELFISLSNPRNYRHFSSYNVSYYHNLWTRYGHLLSVNETKDVLGDGIFWLMRNFYNAKFTGYENLLLYLIDKVDNMMTDSEVYEMFMTKNLLHRASLFRFTLENLWNFFANRTTLLQQKEMLMKFDSSGMFYYYIKKGYINQVFDSSPLNILHLVLLYSMNESRFLIYAIEIYKARFNNTEMQNIILSTNDFLIYAMRHGSLFTCKDFVAFLEKIFEGNEMSLKGLFDRKVSRTNLNVFEYAIYTKELIPEIYNTFLNLYDRLNDKK